MARSRVNAHPVAIALLMSQAKEIDLPETKALYCCDEHGPMPKHDYPFILDKYNVITGPQGSSHYVPACPICFTVPSLKEVTVVRKRVLKENNHALA